MHIEVTRVRAERLQCGAERRWIVRVRCQDIRWLWQIGLSAVGRLRESLVMSGKEGAP
jgi:hypothetical protein